MALMGGVGGGGNELFREMWRRSGRGEVMT